MAALSEPDYVIEKREVLAATPELRMVVLTLAAGQEIPWHWHGVTTDTCIGLEGITTIETRAPHERFEIGPGQICAIPPKRAHRVGGKHGARCKLAILQGVGRYDYNPVGA